MDGLVAVELDRTKPKLLSRCHPTAGHDLPLEDPDWVIAELRAWLARAPAGDGDGDR